MTANDLPTAVPSDLQIILDDLDNSDREAQRILCGLSDVQVNWPPHEAAWSVAQCVDHLARANRAYADCLLAAVQDTRARRRGRRGPIKPPWFSRWFIRTLEPPLGRKLRSPGKIVPASRASRDEVLDAFIHAHNELRTVVREGASLDLNRIRFRNPFVGFLRFTVGVGLLIVCAHDRRHLWQARRVREFPGFPD